jgi:polysaccharide chain length determinant protein (PEP-CTERM system associated)
MDSPVEQLKQFAQAIIARKRLFLIVTTSVALLAVAACFFVPKKYEAKSTVFIERNVIDSLLKGIAVTPSMTDRIRVLRYYMVSRDIVSRTLKRMELDVDKRYADPDAFESLISRCSQNTNINMRGEDLFFVTLIDKDPYFARDYINTLINIYVEENLTKKREESYGASRFLTEQISGLKQKLDEIDARIIEFRKKTGIYSNANESAIMVQIESDEEDLRELRIKKNELQATIRTIEQQLKMLRESTAYGFDAGAGSDADGRIEQLQGKIDELLLVYNDKHPIVVKLRDQIEELQKRKAENEAKTEPVIAIDNYNPTEDPIYVDLKMRLNLSQSELNALLAKEGNLASRIASNEKLLRNFPEDKKVLSDLERERATQLGIYEQMLQRVGISDVSKDMEVADKSTTFRIVDPAILPTNPVGTKRLFKMFAGIMAGLAAGLGIIFALEKLDNSIRYSHSLKELGVAILAEIPLIITEAEILLNRRRDRAAFTFASACTLLVGVFLLHDLLGLSFIDSILSHFKSGGATYRSPYGS